MRRFAFRFLILIVGIMMLTACADITSIGRRTQLPGDKSDHGVAIHLDAKQRLAFAKPFGAVCAEPSPDALSAFATALSGSVSIPGKGAGAISQALQESVASIGVRTQSIQLLRDALYRTCEAYYSRGLNSAQLMALHTRFQDIMVGILAIEQLTGPVVANQVILEGKSQASGSAQLVSIDGILDQARENEKIKNAQLEKAVEKQAQLKKQVDEKQQELKEACVSKTATTSDTPCESKNPEEPCQTEADKPKAVTEPGDQDKTPPPSETGTSHESLGAATGTTNSEGGTGEEDPDASNDTDTTTSSGDGSENDTQCTPKEANPVCGTPEEKPSPCESTDKEEPPKKDSKDPIEKLNQELSELKAQLVKADEAVKAAKKSLKEATETRKIAEENRAKASALATASAEGSGKFSTPAMAVKLDSMSTARISQAVENIVTTIVGKKRVAENCLDDLEKDSVNLATRLTCQKLILGSSRRKPSKGQREDKKAEQKNYIRESIINKCMKLVAANPKNKTIIQMCEKVFLGLNSQAEEKLERAPDPITTSKSTSY